MNFEPTSQRSLLWYPKLFVGTALLWMSIFAVLSPFVVERAPSTEFYSPAVIAWIHCLTVGTLTQIAFGGWFYLRARSKDGTPEPARRLLLRYLALNGGLLLFVVSFPLRWYRWGLPVAGILLGGVFVEVGIRTTIELLGDAEPDPVRPTFVTAFVSLAVMGLLGFTMAHNKGVYLLPVSTNPLHWIQTHALVGIGGWFGALFVGISNRMLLPRSSKRTSRFQTPNVLLVPLVPGLITWTTGIWTGWTSALLTGKLGVASALGLWFSQLVKTGFDADHQKPWRFNPWVGAGLLCGLAGLANVLAFQNTLHLLPGGMLVLMSVLTLEIGTLQRILPLSWDSTRDPFSRGARSNSGSSVGVASPLLNHGDFALTAIGFVGAILFRNSTGRYFFVSRLLLAAGIILTVLNLWRELLEREH